MATPLEEMQTKAIRLLNHVMASEGDERAKAVRDVAEVLVDAREYFQRSDGSMDLQGRSWEYKQWAREIYSLANVAPEVRPRIQANISYHISSVTRERHSEDYVVAHGLKPKSLAERRQEHHKREVRIYRLFSEGGPISDPAEVTEALTLMRNTLSRITPELRPEGVVRAVARELRVRESPAAVEK